MNPRVAQIATKLAEADHTDLALTLIAEEEKAQVKKWHKIVAKIPGVCRWLRVKDARIKRDVKDAKELLKLINAMEKENPKDPKLTTLYKKVIMLVDYGVDDIAQMDATWVWKMYSKIKKAGGVKAYIKQSSFILKLKQEGHAGPLFEACKMIREKKKMKPKKTRRG